MKHDSTIFYEIRQHASAERPLCMAQLIMCFVEGARSDLVCEANS